MAAIGIDDETFMDSQNDGDDDVICIESDRLCTAFIPLFSFFLFLFANFYCARVQLTRFGNASVCKRILSSLHSRMAGRLTPKNKRIEKKKR